MKKDLLTVKELAAELRMSPNSIQQSYRREEIPVESLGRMAQFDLAQVRRVMKRNVQGRMLNSTADQPPSANRGALLTGMITGGLKIP